MNRTLIFKTIFFAKVAASASIGLWVLTDDLLGNMSPWLLVPAAAVTLTILLFALDRFASEHGFMRGVAHAEIDAATRLPSQTLADQVLGLEFAAAERGRPLTVVLFSVDNFKRLAVADGGAAGDRLTLSIGAILKRRTRGMNLSSRRDEGVFITILGGSNTQGASIFVDRVRNDITTLRAVQALVVSVGMAAYDPTMHSADDLLAAAQASMLEARRKGGNMVVVNGEMDMDEGVSFVM